MKVFHVCLGRSDCDPAGLPRRLRCEHKQAAMRRALASLGECVTLHWREVLAQRGSDGLHQAILDVAHDFQPDATFMQLQQGGVLSPALVRQIPGRVMNWSGDVRDPLPSFYSELAPSVFSTSFTNMDDVLAIQRQGFRSDYLQIGFDECIYTPHGASLDEAEIVFMGGNYRGRFPGSKERAEMVQALKTQYGKRFAAYGGGWPAHLAHPFIEQEQEASVYRGCRIAINQNHFVRRRFSSDRLFRALGCGPLVLNRYFPGQELEFTEGQHFCSWTRLEKLMQLIDHYLEHEDARAQIAKQGCALAHMECTWSARMRDFCRIMKLPLDAGIANN